MFTFTSPDNGNPFDLEFPQPITCLKNGQVFAKLHDSFGILKSHFHRIATGLLEENNFDSWEDREEVSNCLDELEHEDADFGNPLCPSDWILVDATTSEDDEEIIKEYICQCEIVQAFLARHIEFLKN